MVMVIVIVIVIYSNRDKNRLNCNLSQRLFLCLTIETYNSVEGPCVENTQFISILSLVLFLN